MVNISNSTLCCYWCGIPLGQATRVTYLNGNLPVCDLCLMRANTVNNEKGYFIKAPTYIKPPYSPPWFKWDENEVDIS